MKECTHTVCRFARSDELILEALRKQRAGKPAEELRLGLRIMDAHAGVVECRMMNQIPKLVTPLVLPRESESSDLFSVTETVKYDGETLSFERIKKSL